MKKLMNKKMVILAVLSFVAPFIVLILFWIYGSENLFRIVLVSGCILSLILVWLGNKYSEAKKSKINKL